HRKLFTGGEVVISSQTDKVKKLSPLKIAQQCPYLVNEYQGQHPVISLGFKDVRGSTYEEIAVGVKKQIAKLYTDHTYLEQFLQAVGTTLADEQRERFCYYRRGKFDSEDIQNSLYFLSKLLKEHFGKPVYILIDEYDTPINHAYVKCKGQLNQDFEDVLGLFRELLGSTLKDNPYVEQSLITGILRIAKADLFSSLNNVREYTLLDEEYTTCYGFTQEEVNELFNQVPTTTSPKVIRKWYNGYKFGKEILYNPWSIMCCLSCKGKLDHYWMDSGGTQLIDSVLLSDKLQQDLQSLVSGQNISSRIKKQISFADIHTHVGLYSLLLFSGYLSPERSWGPEGRKKYELAIPNDEVRQIYEDRLLEWVSRQLKIDVDVCGNFMRLLSSGQVEAFTEKLQKLLAHVSSFHQTGPKNAEVFYNGFMLGLWGILLEDYDVQGDREHGLGRPDVVLIPQAHHGDQAMIIEYKVGQQANELASLAAQGLAQIADREYSASLKMHSRVKRVLQICIAFCGKKVAVQYKRVDLKAD
ncbi:MAG: AAA family ATPase, partial [Bacteroidota bacterium]